MVHRKMRRVAVRRHTMMKLTMFLFSLLFMATAAKNVDPHGVESFAAAKLGSPDYKAPVMPDEKDSFESAFDGWSTFQLTRRGLSAMNRRGMLSKRQRRNDDDDDDGGGRCLDRLRLVLNPTVLTNLGAGHELCAMFDESSQWTIVLPEEGLGYELVVPFPAYGFASLVSHNERLQPKQPKGNKTGGKAVTCEQ